MSEFDDRPTVKKGLYRHYKGNVYRVHGVGCHTEREEYFVVYSPTEPKTGIPEFWLRPYDMFIETVEVGGKTIPRFEKIADS